MNEAMIGIGTVLMIAGIVLLLRWMDRVDARLAKLEVASQQHSVQGE